MPVALLIVDDNARFRDRARRRLEADGYVVVAEAEDGASALEAARRHRPAVVLLDVGLPDMSGLSVAELLTSEPDPPAVVLTSTRDAADFGDGIARSGARGFVPKGALSGDAISALSVKALAPLPLTRDDPASDGLPSTDGAGRGAESRADGRAARRIGARAASDRREPRVAAGRGLGARTRPAGGAHLRRDLARGRHRG